LGAQPAEERRIGEERRDLLCGHRHKAYQRYASRGGQEQSKFLSPYTLFSRPTAGQNLCSRTHIAGYAACCRELGRSQTSAVSTSAVWGAPLRTFCSLDALPDSNSRISCRMPSIASQNRHSLSVR